MPIVKIFSYEFYEIFVQEVSISKVFVSLKSNSVILLS
jgi:hypothetical protein